MQKLLSETKVLRDPIHGYIHIDLQVVWNCLNSPEFQRLKRIRQLGGAFQVYHTAEHSRLSHSLGVYEIVRRMVSEVAPIKEALSEQEKVTVMLAGMLHDLGHGPFSHAFESVTNCHHEEMTIRMILEESEIHRILAKVNPSLPAQVASVIDHTHPNKLLSQLISGQLDADRMDYLLRDAYCTGTKYGEFDLERILRTIRVKDQRMSVKASGMHTIEDYIMARYHMYWQVYYHPVSRSFEVMLNRIFRRLKELVKQNDTKTIALIQQFIPFLSDEKISVQDHFLMDEPACNYGFTCLRLSQDKIVSDLARRLLDRDLFKYEDYKDEQQIFHIKERLLAKGYDPEYYLAQDLVRQRPYQPYLGKEDSMIWVMMEQDQVLELSEASVIVDALVHGESKMDPKLFFPRLD